MKSLIMGPPGAGKGTQAKILAEKFNLVHLSTGDILRSEIDKGSSMGLEAQSYMNAGNLVPDKVLLSMMDSTLENLKDKGLILDGFPRTIPQAEGLSTIFKSLNQKIDFLEIETFHQNNSPYVKLINFPNCISISSISHENSVAIAVFLAEF